ncbi:hypothetical protein U1Q18_003714 [Sarracenia purpurea var. burkii]
MWKQTPYKSIEQNTQTICPLRRIWVYSVAKLDRTNHPPHPKAAFNVVFADDKLAVFVAVLLRLLLPAEYDDFAVVFAEFADFAELQVSLTVT